MKKGFLEFMSTTYSNRVVLINKLLQVGSNGMIDSQIAYVYKGQYKYEIVYPSIDSKDAEDRLIAHEYGHIYLGHLDNMLYVRDLFSNLLIDHRDEIIDLVNKNCRIDFGDKLIDKLSKDPCYLHMIHNISMDCEVNSKILDLSDLLLMEKCVDSYINKKIKKKWFSGSKDDLDTKDPNRMDVMTKFCHPSRYGFDSGLSYIEYLELIVLNLDKFIKILLVANSLSSPNDSDHDGNGQQQQGQSSESSSGSKKSKSNGKGSGTASDDRTLSEKLNDSEFVESEYSKLLESSSVSLDDIEKALKNSLSSEGGTPDDNDKDKNSSGSSGGSTNSDDKPTPGRKSDHGSDERQKVHIGEAYSEGSRGKSPGSSSSSYTRDYSDLDTVEMNLRCIMKSFRNRVVKRVSKRDITYKYNRGIIRDVISPSYRVKLSSSYDPSISFIIDVSGSMNTSLVDRIITSVRLGMKQIDPKLKYDIITWDTELCEHYKDLSTKSSIPRISCGGGTDMAGALDYAHDYYKEDTVIILISDFCDHLNRWEKALSSMKSYEVYGFNYGGSSYYDQVKGMRVIDCHN